ncbi:MAG: two-component system NarL family capsular synthesis sensor histidine kinase [Rhodospirillaceae bacterium]|nr:MAG: two-component system NarL family capsular synthesis sensor histidine kinase [Rhodospirillaceae bacterium]TNC97056.1 MAG: two-component system, NarL family, capsular synthesis sensor histidine kinase RcsC [Stygiobacter sp.]
MDFSADPKPEVAVSASADEGKRRYRFGIRAKLLVAVGLVSGVTLLAGWLAWSSYSEVGRLLATVTRANLPSVAAALKLSEATARLAAAAPALDSSQSQFQRQNNFVALQQQAQRLRNLIEDLEGTSINLPQLQELRTLMVSIGDNVVGRNALVDRRLQQTERSRQQGLDLVNLDNAVRTLLTRKGADADLAVVAQASDLLRQAHAGRDMDGLGEMRRRYETLSRRLAEMIDNPRIVDGALREAARAAITLGSGPENVFELRTRGLMTDVRLVAANEEGRDLVARTSSVVGRIVSETEAAAIANERRAGAALTTGRQVMMGIAVVTVLGPLLFVWMYLGRNIVNRLAGLASAMHRIVEGDYHTKVESSGNDEIADMAGELVVFQRALAQLQDSTDALKESEGRLRTILDTSPLALAISRVSDNAILYVNPRWSELFGARPNDSSGVDAAWFYADPADRDRVVELVRGQGYLADYESRMRRADGTEFWAMMSAAAIDMDGEPAVCVSTADITKRKEQEDALAEAKRTAEDASQAKSLFLATMSHEIRTPMNGVLTMAQLLEDMPLAQEQKEMARVIRDSATALLTIINDILDFSKIESGKLELEIIDMSLSDVIESVAELLAPRASEKGIGLMTYIDPALPDLFLGDATRLRQIVTNLAGNAVKFTDKGYVRISAEPAADGHVRFTISDTGIGLNGGQQAKLFEPFSQADASISRRYGGTGLGLSICRRLVAMMDGAIGVDSQVGQGSNFWFSLPLEQVGEDSAGGPDLAGIAVLLLAEGPMAAEILRNYLGHLGAQVAVVASTDGALAAVRAAALAGWNYDVVLMDAGSEYQTRVPLAASLRGAAGDDFMTRVVLMAAHANYPAAAAAARQAGLFATLSKPIRRTALWRVVGAAANRAYLADEAEEVTDPSESFTPPTRDEAAAAGCLILVAEDNPTNQVVIRRLMERMGYAIEIVRNGLEAWEYMQIRDYGLLLTDCHMPEMDGYELTARVREWEHETLTRLPIVALTADALSGTANKCLECGMDAFLAKPIDRAQMDATIRKLLPAAVALRRRRAASENLAVAPVPVGKSELTAPVLDLTPMREIFGSITDDARELLTLFVDTTRPLVEEVVRHLDTGDGDGAREAAHAAKGAGNSAGCFRFAGLCAEIEHLCAEGYLHQARPLAGRMQAAFDEAAAEIAAL